MRKREEIVPGAVWSIFTSAFNFFRFFSYLSSTLKVAVRHEITFIVVLEQGSVLLEQVSVFPFCFRSVCVVILKSAWLIVSCLVRYLLFKKA